MANETQNFHTRTAPIRDRLVRIPAPRLLATCGATLVGTRWMPCDHGDPYDQPSKAAGGFYISEVSYEGQIYPGDPENGQMRAQSRQVDEAADRAQQVIRWNVALDANS